MDNENFNEESALAVFQELSKKNRVLAKPLRAEMTRQAITFFFLAPAKTDFHLLSRDLNRHFKTHIELKRIGGKEAAKDIPGCGKCGRPLCCRTFLKNPPNYSMDDLKKGYNIKGSLDDLTGSCGKLLCCLVYEPPVESSVTADQTPFEFTDDFENRTENDIAPAVADIPPPVNVRSESGTSDHLQNKNPKHKNKKIVRRLILNK